ncbi:MAG TPA: radical SAM protein, partial [Dissulfurispiraceae bacterium]|nr:radical SAM protein [Dissulfurispiraceae bacterium]
MKPKILLINPWIYDFAAYNLWTRPLGLYKVAEYLSAFNVGLSLIDCMECSATGRFGTGRYRCEEVPAPDILKGYRRRFKRYGMSVQDFRLKVRKSAPVDIVVITSVMAYWYPGVQRCISVIREEMGDVPIILGGIYATLYHKHACDHSGADFIFSGKVNDGLKFAISTFGYKLKKTREQCAYYNVLTNLDLGAAPLLTSTGCTFNCSYCASRLLSDFTQLSPDDVFEEMADLHRLGVRDFAFYDDALLINADTHFKPLLEKIIDAGLDVRLHSPNGLHARFIDYETAFLMRKAGFSTLRLSL